MSFADGVEYGRNDHLKNTLPEFVNITLELQLLSLEIVVGIGRTGLMVKALMPSFIIVLQNLKQLV